MDTSILIDILRNEPYAKELVTEMDLKREYMTTSINEFELLAGSLFIGPRSYERAQLLLSRFTVLEFDKDSVDEAARIYSASRKKGKEIPMRDAMIAGIVKANGKILLTRDKKHFQKIPGLQIKLIEFP
jgi:predicted nucleic acid-binding protein